MTPERGAKDAAIGDMARRKAEEEEVMVGGRVAVVKLGGSATKRAKRALEHDFEFT